MRREELNPWGETRSITNLFRTAGFLTGMAVGMGYTWRVRPWLDHSVGSADGATYVYLGVDCYRVAQPATYHPLCERLLKTPGVVRVATVRIPNRRHSGAFALEIGPWLAELDLHWVEVPPTRGAARREVPEAGVSPFCRSEDAHGARRCQEAG